jgi:hypothetical protein
LNDCEPPETCITVSVALSKQARSFHLRVSMASTSIYRRLSIFISTNASARQPRQAQAARTLTRAAGGKGAPGRDIAIYSIALI